MMNERKLQMPITILLSLAFLTGCGAQEAQKPSPGISTAAAPGISTAAAPGISTAAAPRTTVVARVISQNLNREVRLPADLIAYRDIGIYPKLPGFIEWIGVDRGSLVKKGQLLVRMTAPELPAQSKQGFDVATAAKDESTQAADELEVVKQQLAAAEAKAKSSADTYQRLKGASEYPGIVAGNDLEVSQKTAEADAATARSLEKKCHSLLSQEKASANKHEAAMQSALSNKALESYLRLTAPFDGVITERNVHEGSFVNPPTSTTSQPLLRLKQVNTLRLIVPVPESDVAGITPGASLRFSVSAYPGETFTGVVRRIADSVDINTRTMAVELDVSNLNRRLAPGMFAEVLWAMRRNQPTIFVPQSAVVKTTEKIFVIRVKDGITEWIDVKPGVSADDLIEVFGNLAANDLVVVKGTDELRAGTHVTPQEPPSQQSVK
jgi:RND family efflux transporter MFP subunit